MTRSALAPWRTCFAASSVLLLVGGPQHPRGSMADMLAHPDWVMSHLLLLAGFAALVAGFILLGRQNSLLPRTRWWLWPVTVAAALEVIEMAFHTAAVVDHHNLVTGLSTPVLTTHLALSAVVYPVFGVALAGFILAVARERLIGSRLIAWIGVVGALGHGAAAPLVIVFEQEWAGILFPLIMLVGIWLLLAAIWPARGLLPAPRVERV